MHRVLTDTAKKNDEKTIKNNDTRTQTHECNITDPRVALVQNNKMFKNEKIMFSKLTLFLSGTEQTFV